MTLPQAPLFPAPFKLGDYVPPPSDSRVSPPTSITTTSDTPALTPLPTPSPAKKRKLNSPATPTLAKRAPSRSPTKLSRAIVQENNSHLTSRYESTLRLRQAWADIAHRHEFTAPTQFPAGRTRALEEDDDDIIDLRTLEIVVDRGIIRGARPGAWAIGSYVGATRVAAPDVMVVDDVASGDEGDVGEFSEDEEEDEVLWEEADDSDASDELGHWDDLPAQPSLAYREAKRKTLELQGDLRNFFKDETRLRGQSSYLPAASPPSPRRGSPVRQPTIIHDVRFALEDEEDDELAIGPSSQRRRSKSLSPEKAVKTPRSPPLPRSESSNPSLPPLRPSSSPARVFGLSPSQATFSPSKPTPSPYISPLKVSRSSSPAKALGTPARLFTKRFPSLSKELRSSSLPAPKAKSPSVPVTLGAPGRMPFPSLPASPDLDGEVTRSSADEMTLAPAPQAKSSSPAKRDSSPVKRHSSPTKPGGSSSHEPELNDHSPINELARRPPPREKSSSPGKRVPSARKLPVSPAAKRAPPPDSTESSDDELALVPSPPPRKSMSPAKRTSSPAKQRALLSSSSWLRNSSPVKPTTPLARPREDTVVPDSESDDDPFLLSPVKQSPTKMSPPSSGKSRSVHPVKSQRGIEESSEDELAL